MSKNYPVFDRSAVKNGAPNYPAIKNEDFLPAIKEGIRIAKERIEAIKSNADTPNFENTIMALENSGQELGDAMSVFSSLKSAHGTDDLHEIANDVSPLLASYSNDISLDEDLFKRIDAVWNNKEALGLNEQQLQVLEDSWKGFVRNGAKLNAQEKEQLRKIDAEMAALSPKFNKNALDSTNAFEYVIENEGRLAAVPEVIKSSMSETAEHKGHSGKWVVTLDAPIYVGLVTYAKDRDLRETVWKGWNTRAFNDAFDNQDIVKNMVRLRCERANLLGYDTHADYVLEERMAKTKETVNEFIQNIVTVTKPEAEKDLQKIRDLALADGISELKPWDVSYYAEKLKQKEYDFDAEEFRPYLELNNVMGGLFEHAQKLFGIEAKETTEYPAYHEDVKTYEIYDQESGHFYGVLTVDLFPRPEKRAGAWMNPARSRGYNKDGGMDCPLIAIVCNFTKPTKGESAQLSLDEVETLFHEFGHAMHGMLTTVDYQSISGTSVKWDFVELPSQIMENWLTHKETFDLFARHYKTGEELPEELLQKMVKAQNFMAGSQMLRQMSLASLDMSYHTLTDPSKIDNIEEFEKEAMKEMALIERQTSCLSTSFGHIFAGGYSAGYYSYMWAEGLDADGFEPFLEKGLYNKEQGRHLRDTIFAVGGSKDPMQAYIDYRGREPDPKALLRKRGLLPK